MRLYSRTGVTSVGDDDHGDFEVDEHGAVEVPHELGTRMHGTFQDGVLAWEDDAERKVRLEAEDLARRRDPARLYDLLASGSHAQPDVEAVQSAIDAAVAKALKDERAKVAEANPQPDDPTEVDEVAPLKGAALAEALTDAGLSTAGTADEKRARVAENEG